MGLKWMTRPLDWLGRIVIPIQIRTSMGIEINEFLEFYIDVEKGFMSIGKYSDGTSCKLCNSIQDLGYFKSSLLCKQCILDLKRNVGVTSMPIKKETANKEKKAHRSTLHLLKSLRRLMLEHPGAKQGEYAEWFGVSQARISQLKKLL
ncbi:MULTISPECIES: AbrB/MazE/SpoVT family DNA-binding domain-containing protein [Paenibacillus]|uniref:AbrB/MazE/SpoVT family DNA-binding domain-containing protein n=1 Tax=Paenibacillus TaxID=44249 RepID=UPI000C9F7436|nr:MULTISPECIES: AbrB/MazE/SpoVT family DNA-binding domain-containing protein [Paenibacillus]PNQ82806.1 regulator [Paenibacillus sp. F4]WDZ64092.1 AbrB/MazE/SpoVT family DNA-binding domain-containing protein [Paenibacillus polymyxa]